MIEVDLNKVDIDKLKNNHFRTMISSPFSIRIKLVAKARQYESIADADKCIFYFTLAKRVEKILIGNPHEINSALLVLEPQYNTILNKIRALHTTKKQGKAAIKSFRKEVFDIFNYDKFSKSYTGYGAYELVTKLDVNVCPYCNRNYTNTIMYSGGKSRARLDHWFSQSKHPFLSVSLFNLIPSCHICNSDLKRNKDFRLDTHIHPYLDNFKNTLLFKSNATYASYSAGDIKAISISLEPANGFLEANTEIIKARRNSVDLSILEFYNWHKKEAGRIILLSKMVTKSKLREYLKLQFPDGTPYFLDEDDVRDKTYSLVSKSEDFSNSPLGKFKRDIAYEHKIIKVLR